MAKRKQKGAAFGKKSGGGSTAAYQKQERSRVGMYAIIGIIGVLLFCLAIFITSGGLSLGGSSASDSGSSESIDSGFDAGGDSADDSAESGFEASSDSMADDSMAEDDMAEETHSDSADGFSAESSSMDIEEIDADEFSFLGGDFSMSDTTPSERNAIYSGYPEFIIDEANTYEALIITDKGDIRVRLFDDAAPLTVNNFVYLAQDGFYDETTFHRVIESFMAQAGDPTGTGTGGPGYQFEDETGNGFGFDRGGLLAMANAGPATNGSQFFLTFEPTPWLDGNHTIFGEIIEGTDVLNSLRIRDPQTDPESGDLIETIEIYVTQ